MTNTAEHQNSRNCGSILGWQIGKRHKSWFPSAVSPLELHNSNGYAETWLSHVLWIIKPVFSRSSRRCATFLPNVRRSKQVSFSSRQFRKRWDHEAHSPVPMVWILSSLSRSM